MYALDKFGFTAELMRMQKQPTSQKLPVRGGEVGNNVASRKCEDTPGPLCRVLPAINLVSYMSSYLPILNLPISCCFQV